MELTATIKVYALAATIQGTSLTAVLTPGGLTADIAPASLAANIKTYSMTANVAAGIQGEPGSKAEEITAVAGEPLSALRVVRGKAGGVFCANSSDPADMDMAIGITSNSAMPGESVQIRAFGSMSDSSWNWVLDRPIFYTSTGMLTQTAPAVGLSQQVAIPVTATRININIRQATKLI